MILKLERVCKHFPVKRDFFGRVKKSVKAVADVSLSVGSSETLGVIGESGCGKTTLGMLILGLHKPDSGKVLFMGRDIFTLKGEDYRNYRRSVQAVFQNPQSSLNPRMKVWQIVTEGLRINYKLPKKELVERAQHLLEEVGLPKEFLHRYPHQLSGGQKQRVAIARAMALSPSLIVADEPTSALDVSVQAQIVNLFLEIQEKKKVSYFFISHSLAVVDAISDRVAVMYRGYVVEEGKTDEVFLQTAHPYTKLLLDSLPERRKRGSVVQEEYRQTAEKGCPFYPRCFRRRSDCLEYDMKPAQLTETHRVACPFHLGV
jgi:oligopeptide/dipeptide ABC transporter ATP-binding protein